MSTPVVFETGKPIAPNFLTSPIADIDVVQTGGEAVAIQKIRLTLTSVRIDITDALAYGGARIANLPDVNAIFIGGEADLTVVKDGTGIVTGELPKLALGTAVASNATLSSTMSNLINGGATAGTAVASGLSVSWDYHSNDNVTLIPFVGMADSPTTGIFLNASVNPTGDGYLLVSGTIDMYFINLRNVTS